MSKFGSGASKCHRCGKSVYANELVTAAGHIYHDNCLNCIECKKRLSSSTMADKNGEIYCTTCYAKNFGPKGFGIGGTSIHTGLSVADQSTVATSPTPVSPAPSSPTPTSPTPTSPSAPVAPSASISHSKSDSATTSSASPTDVPAAAPPKVSSVSALFGGRAGIGSGVKLGGGEKCWKCSKTVYAAEKLEAAQHIYHDSCFRCEKCGVRLSSVTLTEREGHLFCHTCYSKEFGPKGFGFAGGAGGLMAHDEK